MEGAKAVQMKPMANTRGEKVEFLDVEKSYGSQKVLSTFSLTIEAGEFLTLLGPSGSGKTTALNLVAGFLNPDRGDILIGGRSISSLPPEKRNIGMVFQNYSLFPHMTVFENVAFPLRMRHAGRELIAARVESALRLVHLAEFGPRRPHELSGGQRQRIAFARAIVFEPKVLLMDEPLGALDLKLREHMQLEIKEYQKQIGCTMIYVTHDQGEALTLSDRIVVMNEGRIVQIGTPQEIYDHPTTKFVATFIGETNILAVSFVEGSGGGWRIDELGCAFPPDDGCAMPKADCSLSIRPEKIRRVGAQEKRPPESVQFEAFIEGHVFLGDVVRYSAQVPGGTALRFKEPRTGGGPALAAGEKVRLGFLASDAVILPGDASRTMKPPGQLRVADAK